MGGETMETARLKSSYPTLVERPVGQWIANIYRDRIAQFYSGGQYEHQNLRACVKVLSFVMPPYLESTCS